MSDAQGNLYNLVFAGQLLPDISQEQAQQALANFFAVDDPSAMAAFFSGRTVPLRRNLSKADAMRIYRQLRDDGLLCQVLPTQNATPTSAVVVSEPAPAPAPVPVPVPVPVPEPAPEPQPEPEAISPQSAEEHSHVNLGPSGPAPNYFALRPAITTIDYPQLRSLASTRAMVAAVIVVAVFVVCAGLLLRFPAPQDIGAPGPQAAAQSRGQLLVMANNALHLHGRSGRGIATIDAAELGLRRITPPLWFFSDGQVVVNGLRADDETLQLWRCGLENRTCQPLLNQPMSAPAVALAGNAVNDVLVVLASDGTLLRVDPTRGIEAEHTLEGVAEFPRLMSAGGLLYLPSAEGPLLGVFRPDSRGFGQQLDALLLMPPRAGGYDRILDAAAVGDGFWVLLSGSAVAPLLQRFDRQWNAGITVAITATSAKPYLIPWQDRVLVADAQQPALQRIAPDGRQETPFNSELLDTRWQALQKSQQLAVRARMFALFTAGLLGCTAIAFALLNTLLAHRLPLERQVSTTILDRMPGAVHWLRAPPARDVQLQRTLFLILLLPVLAAVLLQNWYRDLTLLVCIPALLGSCLFARLVWRGRGGFCGLLEKHLILVDYSGSYCFTQRQHLRGNDAVLCLGDVVLPLRAPGLVNIDARALQADNGPLHVAKQLDQGSIAARLLQQRHPWATATLWLSGGWACSVFLMLFSPLTR